MPRTFSEYQNVNMLWSEQTTQKLIKSFLVPALITLPQLVAAFQFLVEMQCRSQAQAIRMLSFSFATWVPVLLSERWMCIVGTRWYMLHALVAFKDHNKMKKNIFNSYEYKSVESERCGKRSEAKKEMRAWWKLNLSATHCSFITFLCYSPARLHL